MTPEDLSALAFKIADSCAASDIESNCPWATQDDEGVAGEVVRGVGQWYDTSLAIDGLGGTLDADDQEWLTEAVTYLDARGLLIRKDGAPHLVRIAE